MQVERVWSRRFSGIVALCILLGSGLPASSASAAEVQVIVEKDASLYQYDYESYDWEKEKSRPRANGVSDLHVGDTNNNNGVQRGLLRFDLDAIPSDAIVTDVRLQMSIADIPERVLPWELRFWAVALEGLERPWTEGPAGDKTPAAPGDTTWFHTTYDPASHGQLGVDPDTDPNPFRDFSAGDPGYWPLPGYFGHADLGDTTPGLGGGGPFDDSHALPLDNALDLDIGDEIEWSNSRMTSDVQAWVDGSKTNFGWILVGEEWINEDHQVQRYEGAPWENGSCKIDFCSFQTAGEDDIPPTLTVTYTPVPEPASAALLAVGLCLASLLGRRRRRFR